MQLSIWTSICFTHYWIVSLTDQWFVSDVKNINVLSPRFSFPLVGFWDASVPSQIFAHTQIKGLSLPGITNPNFSYYIVDRSRRLMHMVSGCTQNCVVHCMLVCAHFID